MKRVFILTTFFFLTTAYLFAQSQMASYTPTPQNLQARKQYQDNKFGMFIHWGLSSMLADGEWVMQNRNIKVADYRRMLRAFNPVDFNAAQWVSTAKNA